MGITEAFSVSHLYLWLCVINATAKEPSIPITGKTMATNIVSCSNPDHSHQHGQGAALPLHWMFWGVCSGSYKLTQCTSNRKNARCYHSWSWSWSVHTWFKNQNICFNKKTNHKHIIIYVETGFMHSEEKYKWATTLRKEIMQNSTQLVYPFTLWLHNFTSGNSFSNYFTCINAFMLLITAG